MNKIAAKVGKHIIPRNLYHITDAASYEKIKADGYLKPRRPNKSFSQEGVFAFELQNVLKRWQQIPTQQGKNTLLGMLLEITRNNNIVILKIPTKNLNPDNLLIRSQDWYFNPEQKIPQSQLKKIEKYWDELGDIDYGIKFDKIRELKKSIIARLFPTKNSHIQNGSTAKEAPLYKQRGESIEYIYTDKIPISEVEKIGSADRNNFYNNDYTLKIKELLLELFKDQREKIAVEKVLK
ncbi:hypothetical protein HDR58_03835 [bacterium]|nr:hypothetical protein [bacterium]